MFIIFWLAYNLYRLKWIAPLIHKQKHWDCNNKLQWSQKTDENWFGDKNGTNSIFYKYQQ